MSGHVDLDAAIVPHRLVLSGDLDIAQAATLHAAARAAVGAGDVVADLTGVQRLDVAATQILLALRAALTTTGARLIITNAPTAVAATWRRYGLDTPLAP